MLNFSYRIDMFTIASFALALSAVLGGVWWACTADRDNVER
ncbi:MAG: hypothetical protein ACJ8LI_05165 [Chthoniobacterales bacterium]